VKSVGSVKSLAIIIIAVLVLSMSGCGGIHVKKASQDTDKARQEERTPVKKVFVTSDKKYSLTADSDWKDVLAQQKNAENEMTLMLKDRQMYIAVVSKDKSRYDGLIRVREVTDYAEVVIEGMREDVEDFSGGTIKKGARISGFPCRTADCRLKRDGLSLAYRIYFLDTGTDYVELMLWSDSSVFRENQAYLDKIAGSFREPGESR
jgi:flagellar basal body-associated protein FliL